MAAECTDQLFSVCRLIHWDRMGFKRLNFPSSTPGLKLVRDNHHLGPAEIILIILKFISFVFLSTFKRYIFFRLPKQILNT